MSQPVEELIAWDLKRHFTEIALRILREGLMSPEKIAEFFELPLDEVKELEQRLLAEGQEG